MGENDDGGDERHEFIKDVSGESVRKKNQKRPWQSYEHY